MGRILVCTLSLAVVSQVGCLLVENPCFFYKRMLKEKFNFPNNMFAKEFFEYAFGVMVPPAGENPQRIVVRAKGDARYYLEDVPLHKS